MPDFVSGFVPYAEVPLNATRLQKEPIYESIDNLLSELMREENSNSSV